METSDSHAGTSEEPTASVRAGCEKVSGEQAKALVAEGATLLDVRTPQEYEKRHIEEARLVPHDQVSDYLDEIPKSQPVVTYCRSGRRAAAAAEQLRRRGYEVYELGGIDDWDTTGNRCSQ